MTTGLEFAIETLRRLSADDPVRPLVEELVAAELARLRAESAKEATTVC